MANRRFIDFPVATTVGANDIILIWQDGLNKQTTKATILSGLPEDLEDLADVNISGLTNGQILRYDSTTGKWENTDQGNLDLNDLNDVSIVSPSNGQVLVYNSSTSKWENSSGGFVPYVGAVTTVDLGAQGLRAGYVRFNTSVVSVPDEQGLMYWDADNETVAVILNGTIMKIGEDQFYPVKNQTGSTIAKGTAVRFAGTVGASGRLLIAPFIADNSVPSSRFMGVTSEAILNGADGKVMWFGRIRGINTNAFNEGDILYASTTTAGGFQTAIPVAPNNIVQVAAVVTKSTNNGTIFVRPTLGSNINKDEGVKIVSPTTGQLLQLQSNGLWENKTKAQVLGGTSSQFVKGDGSLDSTAYVPTSREVIAGAGLTGGGALTGNVTLSHADTSSQASVDNSNGNVIQDVTLDTYGHITALASTNLDNRYYTETEIDSTLTNYQLRSEKAQPNGYASLDSNGKVPLVQINDALIGNVNFQGLWNAATNTPTLANPPASGTKGYYYIVSTAGTFAGISFEVGDWIISNGTAWGKVDNTDAVSSVFGRTGNVTASNGDYNTSQVTENTNLYYTEARVNANANVAANTAARHNAVTLGTANGLSLSTQQLSLQLATSGQNGALSSTDWTTFNNKENAITAGTNAQYFRGDKTFQTLNTGVVPESGNLYYTDARSRAALSFVAGSGAYNNTTGVITIPTNNNQIANGAGYITSYTETDTLASVTARGATTTNTISVGNQGLGTTGVNIRRGRLSFSDFYEANHSIYNNILNIDGEGAFDGMKINAFAGLDIRTGNASGAVPTTIFTLRNTGLVITGNLSATNLSGINTGDQSLASLGAQPQLNGTGFVKISGTTISYDNSTYLTTASAASTYLPLAGGTLTGALGGTSASFTGKLSVTQASTDFVAEIVNTQNSNPYGLRIKDAASGANNYPLLLVSNNAGSVEYFRVNSGTGAATFSSSVTATSIIRSGGTSAQFLKADGSVDSNSYYLASNPSAFIALTALSGTAPIQYNNTTGAISITQASNSTNGFLSSTDWNTFNNKANSVVGGYLPLSGGTMTGVITTPNNTFGIIIGDDSRLADRNVANTLFLEGTQNNDRGYINFSQTIGNALGAINGADLTWRGNVVWHAGNITPVPTSRTITINGTTQNLSDNRIYNVGTVTSVAALTLGTSGTDLSSSVANGTTTPVITLNVPTASAANRGALSAADWTTFNSKENAITAGTTAQYYRGDKTFQTLNTAAVPESGNLYYTEARVNANTNVAANTAARHNAVTLGTANGLSLSTQILSLGLASSSANGALSSTDWTTFNNKQNALTNPVTGTGTTNYLPKFTGTSTIGNSQIFDNGTNVGIGTTNPISKLQVNGQFRQLYSRAFIANPLDTDGYAGHIIVNSNNANGDLAGIGLYTNSSYNAAAGLFALQESSFAASMVFYTGSNLGAEKMRITSGGNVLIGTTSNAGFKLDVNGTGRFSGSVQEMLYATSSITSGTVFRLSNTSTGGGDFRFYSTGSGNGEGAGRLVLNFNGSSALLNISGSTGAATFSSSVTAGGRINTIGGGSNGFLVNSNVGSVTIPTTGLSFNTGFNVGYIQNYSGGNYVDLYYGASKHIFDGGNVGIGTASPTTNLQVFQTATAGNNYVEGTIQVGGTSSTLGGAFSYAAQSSGYVNLVNLNNGGGANSRISFGFGAVSSGLPANNVMTINQSGNVLIGTTTDAGFKLDVNGTGRFNGNLSIGSPTASRRLSVGSDGANWIGANIAGSGGTDVVVIGNLFNVATIGAHNAALNAWANIAINSDGGNVLIGTATPNGNRLRVNGTAWFDSSVRATTFIVNTSGQERTITTFYASGSLGDNIWIGGGGLNSTTGGGASSLGSLNTSLGVLALQNNTTGYRNTSLGYSSLRDNTTGYSNTSVGEFSLWKNTTGYINSAFGSSALNSNTTGYANSALGTNSLGYITTGRENVAVGFWAGFLINSGGNNTTSSNSTYLGQDTRASADGNTNEVVIGSGARGQGSNSVVIGNGSITKTILRGDVLIGTETPATGAMLNVNGSIRTAAPTGTSTENWRLGRALLATSSDPEDRWIRVQLGTKIYDILAIDRGDA